MPAPRDRTRANPSRTDLTPRVTMSGFMRKAVMSTPWPAPMAVPAARAMGMATQDGKPPPSWPPLTLVPAMRMAAMTPQKETMASTERSMPPVRMTKVWPAATRPRAEASRPMSSRLVGERKAGDMIHSATAMAMSTSAGPAPETMLLTRAVERLVVVPFSLTGCAPALASSGVTPPCRRLGRPLAPRRRRRSPGP